MSLIPTPDEARKVREEIIQLQQWIAKFDERYEKVNTLKYHLFQVRQDLEKLM